MFNLNRAGKNHNRRHKRLIDNIVNGVIKDILKLRNRKIIHITYPTIKYNDINDINDRNSKYIKIQLKILQALAKICQKNNNAYHQCDLPVIIGSLHDPSCDKQKLSDTLVDTGFKLSYNKIINLVPDELTCLQRQSLISFYPHDILCNLGKLNSVTAGVSQNESVEIDEKYQSDILKYNDDIAKLDVIDDDNNNDDNNDDDDNDGDIVMSDMALIKKERRRGKIIKKKIKQFLTYNNTVIVVTNDMFDLSNFTMGSNRIYLELINIDAS